ncbi:hypothetical protein H5410_061719 [Solanum commersonii]|uniref:Uncharacterized protein n=1 Tax=Solanum commersonii TaxID=4109 RepID=A0A9J5W8S4_SOLCO|nr:hypothetical protein H5410_061719 [Solanum commersonii]
MPLQVMVLCSLTPPRYSTSILGILVEDVGITSTSFLSSRGNKSEVRLCLASMSISEVIIILRFIRVSTMQPKKATLARRRTDSFWDGIIVLLIKLNQNLAAMFSTGRVGAEKSS